MYRIMIIEDEPGIRVELKLLLEAAQYETVAADNMENLSDQVWQSAPDLVLLDLGLPQESGLTVCAKIRKFSEVPIIFVTAHNTSMDELNCLMRGGDDFIAKPYQPAILLARIATVLKRAQPQQKDVLEWKGIRLDLASGSITACGKGIETAADAAGGNASQQNACGEHICLLSRNEVKILYYLMKHAGKIVFREALIDYLWEEQVYIDDNALSVNMTRLRGKLSEIGAPDYIQTRRGMGYQI